MSGNDRPELRAYRELETLVRHLGEELAAFRRRAISAETQLKDAGHAPSKGASRSSSGGSERLADLEKENENLRTRLDRAEDRVRQMMDRVRFLRQQIQTQTTGAGAGSGGGRA
jgi:predicted  nucleic acid-binding Zn-ribbon protein